MWAVWCRICWLYSPTPSPTLLNRNIRLSVNTLGDKNLINEDQFRVLKKRHGKFDCLFKEMLFIKKLRPSLNTQSDSISAKISLNVDGSLLTDDSSIAESMNLYFSSVFTTEAYVNFPTQDCIFDKKLANFDCSANEVKRHLLKLKPNKSPGPDYIVPCILKSCAAELAPSLTYMVNK